MGAKMIDVTNTAESFVDIWNYAEKLKNENKLEKIVVENETVESVYRNDINTVDHVLLPTGKANVFIVILVDIVDNFIIGHHKLDLNEKYGLE